MPKLRYSTHPRPPPWVERTGHRLLNAHRGVEQVRLRLRELHELVVGHRAVRRQAEVREDRGGPRLRFSGSACVYLGLFPIVYFSQRNTR